MEVGNHTFEVPSPASPSFQYSYSEAEHYNHFNSSESQSPMDSPNEMLSYMQDLSADLYPSPERDLEESQEASSTSTAPAKAPAKRKRENRYKNAPPSVLSRRRAQNRASQRAYRERKDQRIKDLEQMLNEAKARNDTLTNAYHELQTEYVKLKASQYADPAAAYGVPGDLSGSAFDTGALGLTNNDRTGDLDLFVYPDMGGTYTAL